MARAITDRHAPGDAQAVLARFIAEGHLLRHLRHGAGPPPQPGAGHPSRPAPALPRVTVTSARAPSDIYSVNVETQQKNPQSLLWWMRRLIALRAQHRAFSRGTIEFLGADPAHFGLDWDALPARLRAHQYVDLDPEQVVAEYRRLYPHYTPSEVFFAATTAGRSWRGAIEELEARARAGGGNTWAYQLDWYPRDVDPEARLRAFHTLDNPLVFDNIQQPGSRTGTSAGAQRVADAMAGTLLAFARSGDPRTAATADWLPYSLARRETMVFDRSPRMEHDPRGGERRLYQRVPFVQRGTF